MRSMRMRFILLGILLISFAHCGGDSVFVLVNVQNLLPNISVLHVTALLDGKPAAQGQDFTQQLNQFAIKLPVSGFHPGQLLIKASGLDADGCLVAIGQVETRASPDTPYTELEIILVPLSSPLCMVLTKITPPTGPTTGGILLQLDGQNFAEGSTVTIAGAAARVLAVTTSGSLAVELPALPGTFGKVPVVVRTPDGLTASRGDLFAYNAGVFDFSRATLMANLAYYAIAIGDFNGDHNQDLAAINQNNVSVLLGNGMGGFGAAVNFPAGSSPASVAVGDFNGDQKLDLAVTNNTDNTVSVLIGDGLGSFAGAKNFNVGTGPLWVAVGDFNRDQNLDWAAANSVSNNVTVMLGDGMGGFTAGSSPATGPGPTELVVGDFNSDQNLDLTATNHNAEGSVSVLLGDGKGQFSSAPTLAAGMVPVSVDVADFNGDQKLDLAVGNFSSGNVSVLLGDGKGGFAKAANFPVGDGPGSVKAGDFNGDQIPDLAVLNRNSNQVAILFGDGMGRFGSPTTFAAGLAPVALAVGDFNGDKKLDLAVTSSAGITVLINLSL